MSNDTFSTSSRSTEAGTSASGLTVLSTPYGESVGVRRRSVLGTGAPGGPEPAPGETAGAEEGPALPARIPPRDHDRPGGHAPEALLLPVTAAASEAVSMSAATPSEAPVGTSPTNTADTGTRPAATAAGAGAPTSAASAQETSGAATSGYQGGEDSATQSVSRTWEDSTYDAAPRRRRLPVWTAAASFLLLLGVGVGAYAYASHYEDHALPGTVVAGTDLSGKTREEVVSAIEDLTSKATVTVSGDAEATASLEDLGVSVDTEATADAVMARGDTLVDRFRALVDEQEVEVVTTSDDQALADYATSLIPEDQVKAVNATVLLGEDGATFTTTPSSAGTSLDTTALGQAAKEAAASLSPASVTVSFASSAPEVSDSEAQEVADRANEWVGQDITVANADGTYVYTASAVEKASWITVTNSVDAAPTIEVDPAQVTSWVEVQAADAGSEPVNGERNVNSDGEVVSTPVEAVDGKDVNNTAEVSDEIVQALDDNQAYSGTFEMTVVEATWSERTIADGAENLVYQAEPGEKWIDVDLASRTVTSYEGATVVRGPVTIVDGAEETPTVTGTYQIYLQYDSQTMEGDNIDGSRYRTEDVPWVSYFHGGYAFHGAPWRSDFGYSASHGCVNMPVEEAKWIYDWVDIGTTVVSHY
ncbi:L,D-transpeptidase family protein [Actinomyces wuliandei]|uniref:L,D-transpeptidase family protein n=1 Tax=Actinomyces wuliandei TaxID=2057743 RepID=UPI001FAA3E98|nr:L,D-transpeptidase family protein [Actinomyces wuliandei]